MRGVRLGLLGIPPHTSPVSSSRHSLSSHSQKRPVTRPLLSSLSHRQLPHWQVPIKDSSFRHSLSSICCLRVLQHEVGCGCFVTVHLEEREPSWFADVHWGARSAHRAAADLDCCLTTEGKGAEVCTCTCVHACAGASNDAQ